LEKSSISKILSLKRFKKTQTLFSPSPSFFSAHSLGPFPFLLNREAIRPSGLSFLRSPLAAHRSPAASLPFSFWPGR
jgi:hypothetical protein